jgi:two-component system chemotaxis response regulator CheB
MKTHELIRVLVVDDSAYSRRSICRMLERSPLVRVVATAADGEEALRKLVELEPDLVTLDLELPRMDGFTLLRLLMQRRPTPVLVISARSGHGDVFRALELGAVDFIAKPALQAAFDLEGIEQELIRKVHATHQLRIDRVRERLGALPAPALGSARDRRLPRVVAIGSSTGGPSALLRIFGAFLEPPPCAFLVAQHMPRGFTESFAERIDRLTALRAREARDGDPLDPGSVLVAPGEAHLELASREGEITACVVPREPADKYAPSVDRLFASAAKHVGAELLAIVLTGMGDDGRAGVVAVKESGGQVIAESEQTAVIFGMPQQAIRTGRVDQVLPLGEIAGAIGAPRSP